MKLVVARCRCASVLQDEEDDNSRVGSTAACVCFEETIREEAVWVVGPQSGFL